MLMTLNDITKYPQLIIILYHNCNLQTNVILVPDGCEVHIILEKEPLPLELFL